MGGFKNLSAKLKNGKIFFLLIALWFGLEYFIFGPFSYGRVSDNLDAFAVRAILAWRAVFSGGLSYWQPYFTGGMDRLSNMASMSEIGNLIFFLPSWLASAIIIVGGIFLGGYYTFRLSHEILGFGKKASAAAGALLSLFLITEDLTPFITGVAILPFVLFYLEKIFFNQRLSPLKKGFYFLIIGVIYSFFSSLVLTLPFISVAIIIWFAAVRKQKSFYFYLALLLFFLPAGLLKFQEAWSLLVNSPLSRRGGEITRFQVSFKQYFFLAKSFFVINSVSLFFIAAGIVFIRKNKLFATLSALALFFLFFPPLYPIIAGTDFGRFFGPFRNFDFSRFYLLIPFFASISVAAALDHFKGAKLKIVSSNEGRERNLNPQSILAVICLALILLTNFSLKIKHFNFWLRAGSYYANTYSPDLKALVKQTANEPPFRIATLNLKPTVSCPCLSNFFELETVDASVDVTSRRVDDFFSLMSGDFSTKTSMYFFANLEDKTLIKMAEDFDPAKVIDLPLLSLFNARFVVTDNLINSPDWELLPTPSAAAWRPWGKMGEIEKIKFLLKENFTGKKVLIYENKNYFPRFFLTKKVRVFASEADLLEELATATMPLLRENVFLVKSDADKLPKLSGRAEKIEVVKYTNDKIKLKIESDGPAVLVIGNGFSPFWQAYVNGEKKEIMPAYHALMAVPLIATTSEIELIYNPPYKF
jgi:hypothetical protein